MAGLRSKKAAGKRRLTKLVHVHAAPVVLDLDDDVTSLVIGVECEGAFGPLVSELSVAGWLDPVIDGVSHEVHQGVGELFDDQLVDLGVRSGDDQANLLVVLSRGLPDDASELVEHLAERDHADVENSGPKLGELSLEAPTDTVEVHHRLPVDRLAL